MKHEKWLLFLFLMEELMKSIIKSALLVTLLIPGMVSAAGLGTVGKFYRRAVISTGIAATAASVGIAGSRRADKTESFVSWLGRGCGWLGESPAHIAAEKARLAAQAKAASEKANSSYFSRAASRIQGYTAAYKNSMVNRPARTTALTLAAIGLTYAAYRLGNELRKEIEAIRRGQRKPVGINRERRPVPVRPASDRNKERVRNNIERARRNIQRTPAKKTTTGRRRK